jgi:hypothetical protein
MVPPWFPGEGLLDQLHKIFQAAPGSKGSLEVHLLVAKKARAKLAVR